MTNEVRRAIEFAGELGKRAEALMTLPRDPDALEAVRIELEETFRVAKAAEDAGLKGAGTAEEYWQAHTQRVACDLLIRALYGLPADPA